MVHIQNQVSIACWPTELEDIFIFEEQQSGNNTVDGSEIR